MIESVRDDALAGGLITRTDWEHGIADLHRTAADGGTFHYTFFKASAVNPLLPVSELTEDSAWPA